MRGEFDQLYKTLGEGDPRGLLHLVGLLPLDVEADVQPIEREIVRDPGRIDQGYMVRRPGEDPWVAHVEAFTKVPADAGSRVFWYGLELLVRLRRPVRCTILLMSERHGRGAAPAERMEVLLGGFSIGLELKVVRLWEVPAELLLAADRPRLLSWVPMTSASESDLSAARRRLWAMRDRQAVDTFRVVGEMRYGKEVWLDALQHWGEGDMSFKQAWQELIEEAESYKELVAEAAAKVAAEAAAQVAAEAAATASRESIVKTASETIRLVVAARFPDLEEFIPTAETLADPANSTKVLRAVAVARDRDEALQALRLCE